MTSVSFTPCRVCGRALKKAESVARGIGPICLKKTNSVEVAAAVAEDRPVLEPIATVMASSGPVVAMALSGPGEDELDDFYDEDDLLAQAMT